MNPSISIILPFFNAGDFFTRSLDSIANQTFKDFEVLLIDDGSTDDSSKVCQKYVAEDDRFKYHFKQNGGVSSARNLGIRTAVGKYIAFIDSDDFVNPDFCQVVFDYAEKNEIDVLNFGHTYYKDGNEAIRNPAFPNEGLVTRENLLEVLKHSASNKFLYFCWSRLFRTDFLRGKSVFFNENSLLGSDSLFNLQALLTADRIFSIRFHPYHYIYNNTSLTQRKFKDNLLHKYETQFRSRLDIQMKYSDASSEAFKVDISRNYIQNALFMLLFNLKSSNGARGKELHQIHNSEIFEFAFKHYQSPEGVTLMMKLKIFLFRYRLFFILNFLNR